MAISTAISRAMNEREYYNQITQQNYQNHMSALQGNYYQGLGNAELQSQQPQQDDNLLLLLED